MEIKIPNEVSVKFTGKGLTYVLDLLSTQPFKDVNGLIGDILNQLKQLETKGGGDGTS